MIDNTLITSFEPVQKTKPKQDNCLVGDKGHRYMYMYDKLTKYDRYELQNCKYNLCMGCIMDRLSMDWTIEKAIRDMEDMIEGRKYFTIIEPDYSYDGEVVKW